MEWRQDGCGTSGIMQWLREIGCPWNSLEVLLKMKKKSTDKQRTILMHIGEVPIFPAMEILMKF